MHDEYSFLRGQYEEILRHCDYLLRHSTDVRVLSMASESKERAEHGLAELDLLKTSS